MNFPVIFSGRLDQFKEQGIRKFLQGGGTGGPTVRGGDMGADPKDRAGAG